MHIGELCCATTLRTRFSMHIKLCCSCELIFQVALFTHTHLDTFQQEGEISSVCIRLDNVPTYKRIRDQPYTNECRARCTFKDILFNNWTPVIYNCSTCGYSAPTTPICDEKYGSKNLSISI